VLKYLTNTEIPLHNMKPDFLPPTKMPLNVVHYTIQGHKQLNMYVHSSVGRCWCFMAIGGCMSFLKPQ